PTTPARRRARRGRSREPWVRQRSRPSPAAYARTRASLIPTAGNSLLRAVHRLETAEETQKSWRRPIFPKGCPLSIFGAGELNFRVRDGNGYGLSANVTRIRCVWMGCSAATNDGQMVPLGRRFSAVDLRDQ